MPLAVLFRYAKTVGVPTLFALVLLWAFIFKTPAATAQQVDTLSSKFDEHQKMLIDSMAAQRANADKQLRFLYLMCLNTAGKNQAARDACETVLR